MNPKLEQFLANNPNPVLSAAKDGTVLYSNEAGEPLLNEWGVEVGDKVPSYIEEIVQKVISKNSPKKMEVKAGERIYLVAFHPLLNEECVNIYGFDISCQKEYEEEPHESERRYHQLFENMLDGFAYCKMLYDECGYPVDFIYIDTNSAFERLTGLKIVKGKRATELFPGIKESHPELFDIYNRVALTGQPERFEIDFKSLGMWFSISVYSMESEHFVAVFDNITERKQTENAIKKSRFIFAKSQEMAHVGNWAWNVQTGKMTGSDENYRIYGCEPGDVCQSEDWTIARTHPDDRALLAEFIRSVKQDGMRKSLDYRIVRLNGDTRYVTTVADKIVWDMAGKVRWVYGITQDITERKRVEEALRESEEKFRTLFENASVAIFVADIATGEIIDCNRNAEKLIGSPRREIIRLHQTRLHPADKAQYYRKMFASHLHDTVIKNYEAEVQHSDGRVIPVLINAAPLKINGRNVTIGFFLDITERKRVEEDLKKAHDTLEEKVKERTAELEEACNSLLENELRLSEAQKIAHLGNWEWNLLTDKIYWSDEIYHIFGLGPQEFGGTYDAFLSRVDPEDRSYVQNATQQALNGEHYNIEYRITLPDGEKRIVHSQGEVVFDEKRTPIRMRGVLQDITERKKAQEALERMDKIRIKEIHHRIKNNLQVISSLLDLQAEKFEEEKVKEAFREGQNRVISMSLLHEELYKGEGTDTLDFSSYLQKLAENLFSTYNLYSKNVRLSIDLEDNAFIDMDTAIPLGIIVNELVSNSLKHAFTEDEEGEIRIRLCREEKEEENEEIHESSFSLTISDDGKGIPDDLELENAESLGLQLVGILVDQLDGELELKRDNGTEFTIKFNVTEHNKTSAPAQQQLVD